MKVTIEITKKYFFILCTLIVLGSGSVVYALHSGNPTTMGHTGDEIDSLSVSQLTSGFLDIGSGEIRIDGEGSRVLSVGHSGGTNALFFEGSAEITRDLDVSGTTTFPGHVTFDTDSNGEGRLTLDRGQIRFDGGSIISNGATFKFTGANEEFDCSNPAGCKLCIFPDGRVEVC
jgi:hypothetical protein